MLCPYGCWDVINYGLKLLYYFFGLLLDEVNANIRIEQVLHLEVFSSIHEVIREVI